MIVVKKYNDKNRIRSQFHFCVGISSFESMVFPCDVPTSTSSFRVRLLPATIALKSSSGIF